MIYRYPSVHLGTVVLVGCTIATTFFLFTSLPILLFLLSGVAVFSSVTVLCFHSTGQLCRDKLTQLLMVSMAVYSNKGREDSMGGGTIATSKGPVSSLVHYESQKIVQLITRDFVMSWYSLVSRDKDVPRDVVCLLQYLALDLYFRLQRVNIRDTVLHMLPVINPFLIALNEVGHSISSSNSGQRIYDVNHPYCVILFEKNPRLIHPALKSSFTEVQYLQKLLDSYLISSVPSQYLKCDVALQLVRNVLVDRLFKSVFDLLCDPVFLIECIPLILSKLPDTVVQEILTDIHKENDILKSELSKNDGLLTPLLNYHQSVATVSSWEQYDHEASNESSDTPLEMESTDRLVQSVSAPTEELVLISLPSIYISRNVSVDTKDGQHAGYIIKFPKTVLGEECLQRLDLTVDDEMEALKRYSEFSKLHKALLKSDIAPFIKGINLPDKRIMSNLWSKVSFSDIDPALMLERQEGLDKYIQSISNVQQVKDSELFREFLESGVLVLQDAHIISAKKAKLSRRKPATDQKKGTANTIETRPSDFEHVLEVFLDMQVLVPCRDMMTSASAPPTHCSATAAPEQSSSPPVQLHSLIEALFVDYSTDQELFTSCYKRAPLFSSLMSLVNDATSTIVPELWLTNTTTQLAIVNLLGPFIDASLWMELESIAFDDIRWARMLYNLRHTVWPNNQLITGKKNNISETEKKGLRLKAIASIKQFLPSIIPYLIGKDNYLKTIEHCLDSIQNPRINRHFLFHLIDLMFNRIVPEFSNSNFQNRLMKLRSKPPFVSN